MKKGSLGILEYGLKKPYSLQSKTYFSLCEKGHRFFSEKTSEGAPFIHFSERKMMHRPEDDCSKGKRVDIFKEVRKEWGDYLETESRIDKEKFEIEAYDIGDLFKCYKEWKEKRINKTFQDSYEIAEELLKSYKIPSLSEKEINEFIKEVEEKEYWYNGIFPSAMINELYKNEEIHLSFCNFNWLGFCNKDKKIVVEGDCGKRIGVYMESGEIVVEGDCESWTGKYITGGEIIVKGDCGEDTGTYMKGGKIVVKGDCGEYIGNSMEGGEIVVKGDCGKGIGSEMKGGKIRIYCDDFNPKEQISEYAKKGEIYHKDKLVWKDGELMGDEI